MDNAKGDPMRAQTRFASLLGSLMLLTCPPVFAAEGAHWYAGVSFGGSQFDLDDQARQIDADLVLGGAASSSTITRKDSDSGLKAYGGYSWSKYFGVEFGFVSPGEAVLQTQVPGELFVGAVDVSGWFGAFVATLPLGKGFSVHAKGGPFAWKLESDLNSTTTTTSVVGKNDGFDFMLGAGLGYEINEDVGARFEFERFQVGDDSFDYISAGLLFRF
jgi:OmpA-OmpF porin, OOP family